MISRNMLTSIGPSPVQVWFSDYRQIGDLLVSHSNTTLFPGEKHVTTVSEIRINEAVDDEVFELAPTPTLGENQLAALIGTYIADDGESGEPVELVEIATGDAGLVYSHSGRGDHPLPLLAINDTLFLVGTGYEMRNLEFTRPVGGRSPQLRISKGEEGQIFTNAASRSQ